MKKKCNAIWRVKLTRETRCNKKRDEESVSFRRADDGTFFQVGALKRTLDFPHAHTYVRYVVAAELFQ